VHGQHRGQIEVREDVAVQHDHAPVDEVSRVAHAARRAEGIRLDDVSQADLAELLAGHDRPDRRGPVRDGQDHVLHAVGAQKPELVAEERCVQKRHDRLGPLEGERAEPGSQAPGQDDGLEGHARGGLVGGAHSVASLTSITGMPSRMG
jgi:hypothetical protein